MPFEAYLADRYGPRPLVLFGAVLVAASWVLYSKASTLEMLYAGGVVGGVGTGLVYGACVGNAVKWFEKRRGLAAGLTSAGFGGGAAITVVPLTRSLVSRGYQATLFNFALIQGGIILLAALALRKPSGSAVSRSSNPRLLQTRFDSSPMQTLRHPVFWLMYVAFLLVAATGLMVTAQLAPIASFFGIAQKPLALIGWTIPALTFSLSLNNLMNGVGRPLFGWLSDLIGREFTLFMTFLAGRVAILFLGTYGRNPVGFVLFAAVIFLTWDIYSVFPALTSDHFGNKYASTNYAMLYTAKGTAALFVPIGSLLAIRTGNWYATLVVAALADILAALVMITLVRPLRLRELRRAGAGWNRSDASTQVASP